MAVVGGLGCGGGQREADEAVVDTRLEIWVCGEGGGRNVGGRDS